MGTARHRFRLGGFVGAAVLVLAAASPVEAHGYFQKYRLPVPLWLYLTGAGATVAVSFVMIALFVRAKPGREGYPRINLLRSPVGRLLAPPGVVFLCRLAAVALFVLVVLGGLIGNQNAFKNIAPTMVWVIWWVGLAYLSTLLGDVWALINPWRTVFTWVEYVYRRLRPGGGLSLRVPYPGWLGVWPAVGLFVAFAWMELVWQGADHPAQLARAILIYSGITWGGMVVFGRDDWLRGGEAFTVFFSLLARFSPTEVRVTDPAVCGDCGAPACRQGPGGCVNCYGCFARAAPEHREWNLRPYAVGLLDRGPVHPSMMAFVLLILSTVTFDGFLETPLWAEIQDWLLTSQTLRPMLIVLRDMSGDLVAVMTSVALVIFPFLFLGFYLLFSRIMAGVLPGDGPRTIELARLFVLSLVPISIAYHLAHYIWFLLVAGQFMYPLASDPFGDGWDLFGTVNYMIDTGVVGPRFIWFLSIAAIVIGHVVAVYLAHMVALRAFPDPAAARRSQYPMLALMVGYTMTSLWIMAQPIVEVRPGA